MRKSIFILAMLFVAANSLCLGQVQEKSITANFNGMNDQGLYEFIDLDDEIHTFDNIDKEVDFDLDDEDYIGQSFIITWKESESKMYDENNEPTGQVKIVKTITGLKDV